MPSPLSASLTVSHSATVVGGVDAGLVEVLGVVPDADDAQGERQRVGAVVDRPPGHGPSDGGDLVGRLVGEVAGEPGVDVGGELAAATLHVDVGEVAALERGGELVDHVLVGHGGHLHGDSRVVGLVVGSDLVVVALARLVVGVVPPGDGVLVATAGGRVAAAARCREGQSCAQQCQRRASCLLPHVDRSSQPAHVPYDARSHLCTMQQCAEPRQSLSISISMEPFSKRGGRVNAGVP